MNSVTPMRLSARKIQGGRIIWSMDSAETQAVLSVEDAPFGFAWINAQGAVRSENEIFQTYSNTERTEIVESALRA